MSIKQENNLEFTNENLPAKTSTPKQCEISLPQDDVRRDSKQINNKRRLEDDDGDKTSNNYFASLFSLFRYADKVDLWLMLIGSIAAALNGLGLPFIAVAMGRITDIFAKVAQERIQLDDTNRYETVESGNSTVLINDTFIGSGRDEFITFMQNIATSYFCVSGGTLAIVALQVFCWEMSAERQVNRMRKAFFSQILRQESSWYDVNKDGDLTQRLSDDMERIREGIGCKMSFLITYLFTFIFGITVGFLANTELTLVLMILAPIVIGFQAFSAKNSATTSQREQIRYGVAGGIASEVLNSIKLVAAFSSEIRELKRYVKALEDGSKMALKKYFNIALTGFFLFITTYGTLAIAFWYSSTLILSGQATVGEIFTVFFSVMAGAFTVSNCLPYINMVSTAVGTAPNIFNVINRIPNIDSYSSTGSCIENLSGIIDFHDVDFYYPSRPQIQILKGLSMRIESGKRIAVVGSSGSGKSTLINLILRFYDPSSGMVCLDGKKLSDLNLPWLRGRIGLVSQEPVLFGVSIAENIRYGRDHVTMDDIIKATQLSNAHDFILALPQGYDTEVGNRGTLLSGGQKQRIAIARALIRDPKILLLDEATSALDSESEALVQEALDRAMKGRTTVIIAHRLSTIRNADLILTMKDGKVHETGNHDELMALRGLYYTLVTTQQKQMAMQQLESSSSENEEEIELNLTKGMSQRKKSINNLLRRSVRSRKSSIASEKSVVSEVDEKTMKEELAKNVSLIKLCFMLKGQIWLFVLGVLGCIVLGILMPLNASFYADIFQTFMLSGERFERAVAIWTHVFGLISVIAGFSYYFQLVGFSILTERIIMTLRESAFRSLLSQECSWFDYPYHSPGKLITSLSRDPPRVKTAAGYRAGQVIVALSVLVTSIVISFISCWKLAAALSSIVPLMLFANYREILLIRRHMERDSRLMDAAGQVSSEGVKSLKTVQALGKENLFLERYSAHLQLPFEEGKSQAVWYSLVYGITQALLYVMYGIGFLSAAYFLVDDPTLQPSQIYRAFFALSFCATFVGQASSYVQEYYKAKISIAFVYALTEQFSEDGALSDAGTKLDNVKGEVELIDVEFRYPSRREVKILKGLSLKIPQGTTVALVGRSGCGKSTVMSLLQRFYTPTKGNILLDGVDISKLNIKWLRQQLGVVTQEPVLMAASIKENIAYGATNPDKVTIEEIIEAAKTANIHKFIATLPKGYDTEVGDMGAQLSGGQKQRIAIARAIIRNPKILLLDEATSALDTESEKIVQEALDRARSGRTCIVIAHRLSTIRNADMIAVVQHGKVIECGTHNRLIQTTGFYSQLVDQSLM